MAMPPSPLGPVRLAIAAVGSAFIYLLIRAFGRRVTQAEVPWLWGPFGGDYRRQAVRGVRRARRARVGARRGCGPLRSLDTASGVDSEIALLREPSGRVRYAGWSRRLSESGLVVFTGFYMTELAPRAERRCVKVAFPMPQGNATVMLRPSVDARGDLRLRRRSGDAAL
ncbi:MAG: hypothetical protein K0R38_3862 [Polyangiaceae bacterium]|jgi:hypothetical protein|nr:hypothetical protein [Polyangiaceae bacterium]